MRVAILQAGAVDESVALADVGGELQARGHAVCILLEQHEPDFDRAIADWRSDVVVVQAAFMAEPWIRATLLRLPSRAPVVLVGTAATFDNELPARVGAPFAIQGELDDALPAFVHELSLGDAGDPTSVPGVVWVDDAGRSHRNAWGPAPDKLDDRPLPARGLYYDAYPFMGRFPWKRFTTGRGCVHSCGFCYLPGLRDGHGDGRAAVRRKSVDRVIREVDAVRRPWPLRRIHFADDLFAPSRAWLEEFAERFPREVGLPFSCNTSPETVTEVNAGLLARAGAAVVGIGLETGNEANRIEQLGRPTKTAAIRAAASRLKGAGIQLLTFNMLANPGEQLDDALATLTLNQELGTDFPRVNLAYPMPGSYLERQLKSRGQEPPPPDLSSRGEWRAWCAEDEVAGRPFEIVQRLFRLSVRTGLPPAAVRRLANLPWRAPFGPLSFYDGYVEMRWSGVPAWSALRYARHAGRPNRRVTYHESLP